MQPTLCSRCKKNIATVFITRMEGDKTVNEGLCLKCAKSLGLPQVNEMMQRMGITDEDLDNLNNEMMQAMDSIENVEDLPGGEDDEEAGKTATFPFLNRLFNNGGELAPKEDVPTEDGSRREKKEGKPNGKRKFLEGYCISLNRKAKEGKLDPVIGRAEEIERVIQILNRRQKNNPCLIGEPGVGKTAIAEGLAQRIVAGDVPFKLRDKEVYLLDLTALVAGTQFRGQFEQRMKGLIDEVKKLCTRTGGFVSHFGTSSSDAVHKMAEEGNKKAIRVWDGMKYQIVKYIGAMAAVLHFNVDAIVYTAGMAYEDFFCDDISAYVSKIAPIIRLPGEEEMRSLAEGALRVLRGEQEAAQY